ncbi:MAG: hypothetical protein K2X86_00900 [Cytophagaceae bacterium]|nr:hypothetical protein [Cytophagaceae bacterium]
MKTCLFLAVLFLTVSCSQEKSARISSKSPGSSNEIIIKGVKRSIADPWITSFIAKGGDTASAPQTEIFASDLSPEYVKFNWKGENTVFVEFTQTDDTKRTFNITMSSQGMMMNEVNPGGEDDDWDVGVKLK